MEVYGYGFGDGSGWGTIGPDGTYYSQHEEDAPLAPLGRFKITDDITMYVYQYAIVGVTDGTETLITRMD
jgi:hypothetical protein